MFNTIKKGLVLLFGLLAILILVFNSYGVEPTLRLALQSIESRTGTRVTFASATGSLLSGSLSVNGVKMEREVDGRNAFSLEVPHLTADISWLRLFDPEWQLDRLHLLGPKGDFKIMPREGGAEAKLQGGKVFAAREVLVSGADLSFTNYRDDPSGVSIRVEVEELKVQEYRARWSLYDLLFRSTLKGKIDGEDFSFTRAVEEGKQVVTWNLSGLPAAKWQGGWIGGALAMGGVADVVVVNQWPVEDPRTIAQAWRVAYRGSRTFEFASELPRGNFEGAQSLKDAGLGEVVAKGLAGAAAGKVKEGFDRLKAKIFGGL